MKKKCTALALWSFAIALAIYVFTYFVYHYMGPDGTWVTVFQEEPVKPFVTQLLGIWGVMFQFAGVMGLLVGRIFFSEK